MLTSPTQSSWIDVRTVTTPHGLKIRTPILHVVHGRPVLVTGARYESVMNKAEKLINKGQSVRFTRGHPFVFYARRITKSMVGALGRLKGFHQRHGDDVFAHRKDFNGPAHGDWARLRHWGLIEPRPGRDGRGWWRLTGLGHAWLRAKETIPRAVAVIDGTAVGYVDANDRIGVLGVDPEFSLDAVLGRPVVA